MKLKYAVGIWSLFIKQLLSSRQWGNKGRMGCMLVKPWDREAVNANKAESADIAMKHSALCSVLLLRI